MDNVGAAVDGLADIREIHPVPANNLGLLTGQLDFFKGPAFFSAHGRGTGFDPTDPQGVQRFGDGDFFPDRKGDPGALFAVS